MRVRLALAVTAAATACGVSQAQLGVSLPWKLIAAPAPPPTPSSPPRATAARVAASLPPSSLPSTSKLEIAPSPILTSDPPLALILSTFSAGFSGGGSVRAGTSWTENITQFADSISVGGTARDENGWGATGLSLNATGMNSLVISAQRNSGNVSSTLFVQFEDLQLRTYLISVNTALFSSTALTSVTVPLGAWTVDFGPAQITGWSIGGGGLGTENFRMTFDNLQFSTSAIPEPETYAVTVACAALVFCGWQRRRRKDSLSRG